MWLHLIRIRCDEHPRHIEARCVGERPERHLPDQVLGLLLGLASVSSETDDDFAGRVGDPKGVRNLKGLLFEEFFCCFLDPLRQQCDLEGGTDLLAQTRRGEDEGLIAVRLQHDENVGHGALSPSHHFVEVESSGVNEYR